MTDLERLTLTFWTPMQRIRRMQVPERDKVLVLADVEAVCRAERDRRERAAVLISLAQLDLDPVCF